MEWTILAICFITFPVDNQREWCPYVVKTLSFLIRLVSKLLMSDAWSYSNVTELFSRQFTIFNFNHMYRKCYNICNSILQAHFHFTKRLAIHMNNRKHFEESSYFDFIESLPLLYDVIMFLTYVI